MKDILHATFAALSLASLHAVAETPACTAGCYISDRKYNLSVVAAQAFVDGNVYHQAHADRPVAKWTLEAVPNEPGWFYLKDGGHGYYLVAGDTYDGRVYHQKHNGRDNAKWKFVAAYGNYYVVDKKHGKGLAAGDAGSDGRIYHQDPAGRANATWAVAAAAVARPSEPSKPATSQAPSAPPKPFAGCQPGYHPNKAANTASCVPDDFVPGASTMTAAPQQAERAAWKRYDDAVGAFETAAGNYKQHDEAAEALSRQIETAKCGQFTCDTSGMKSRRSTHRQQMSAAEDKAEDALKACKPAEAAIASARAQEKAAGLKPVSVRNPSCPLMLGKQSQCARGAHWDAVDKRCERS